MKLAEATKQYTDWKPWQEKAIDFTKLDNLTWVQRELWHRYSNIGILVNEDGTINLKYEHSSFSGGSDIMATEYQGHTYLRYKIRRAKHLSLHDFYSLEGCPDYVTHGIDIVSNTMTSLKGIPNCKPTTRADRSVRFVLNIPSLHSFDAVSKGSYELFLTNYGEANLEDIPTAFPDICSLSITVTSPIPVAWVLRHKALRYFRMINSKDKLMQQELFLIAAEITKRLQANNHDVSDFTEWLFNNGYKDYI